MIEGPWGISNIHKTYKVLSEAIASFVKLGTWFLVFLLSTCNSSPLLPALEEQDQNVQLLPFTVSHDTVVSARLPLLRPLAGSLDESTCVTNR